MKKANQNDLQPAKTQISGASSLTDQGFVIYVPLIQPCLERSVLWVANTRFHIKHVTDIHIKSVVASPAKFVLQIGGVLELF